MTETGGTSGNVVGGTKPVWSRARDRLYTTA